MITLTTYADNLRDLDLPLLVYGALRDARAALEADARRNATTRPQRRSGRLRESIRADIKRSGDRVQITLSAGGSTAPHARIQEEGGEVRARSGRYLAIPLEDHLRGRSPRSLPGRTHVRESKAGNLLIFGEDGRPLYLLRERIRIKPTRYLARAMEAGSADVARRLGSPLASDISEALT